MILELGDGRELKFPDEMADETARQLKTLILALEERARTAESQARLLGDEMVAVRKQLAAVSVKTDGAAAVVAAIAELQASLEAGVKKIVNAELADTVLITDSIGEQTRSRKVPRGE